jgi:hypothetical protein
MLKPYSP